MDGLRSLLACAVLALLSSSSFAATGLQVYYYRNSSVHPQEMWRVEGMATLFKTVTYVAYLLCNTTSNNGSGIIWMRGQVTVNSSLTEKLAMNGVLLLINDFTTNDLGDYTCFDSLSNSYLTINLTTANPAIQAVNDVVTIEAGSSGQLKVYVSAIPNPTSKDITWLKVGPGENTTELNTPTVNFSSDHRTLLLNNIEPEDGGIYKCIVSQSFLLYRSANVYINVIVLFPATITQQPSNLSLVQSANANLSCSATGSPAPNLTWRRTGGSGLPYSATIVTYGNSTTTTSTLSIVNTQLQDGGQYQCQAIVPGTTPVWSQPGFIQVQQQATPSAAMATSITTSVAPASSSMTPTAHTTDLISDSPLAGLLSVIVGSAIGGVISSMNGFTDSDGRAGSTSSMVHNPNYNVTWKRGDHCYPDDTIMMGNMEVSSSSPPKSASDVGSPNNYVAEDAHVPNHVYSIATPPQQSDGTYSRLQWGTSIVQKYPPPPPPFSSQNDRIPMRRMGPTTPSVVSEQLDLGEYPLSLNPSTISALSSVPSMSPDLIPPSNLYKSTTLPTKTPAPFSPNQINVPMVVSLQSIPEDPSMPAYATTIPREVDTTLNSTPTPYLTPSMNSLLGVHNQVTVTPNTASVQYEELPPTSGLHFQPWYEEDHDTSVSVSSPNLHPASSSLSTSHSSRPPREIQPYATIHNSAIPLSGPPRARSHSKHLPPAFPSDSLDTSFSSAVELV
ncbi:hypothetical protein EMCRGX_G019858 [Ephydatia muelleri]